MNIKQERGYSLLGVGDSDGFPEEVTFGLRPKKRRRQSDENKGEYFRVVIVGSKNLRQLGSLEEQRESQCVDHSG